MKKEKEDSTERVKRLFNNPLFLVVLIGSAFARATGEGFDFILTAMLLVLWHGFIVAIVFVIFLAITDRDWWKTLKPFEVLLLLQAKDDGGFIYIPADPEAVKAIENMIGRWNSFLSLGLNQKKKLN